MSITRRVPVQLTPEEADQICKILTAYAAQQWDHARTTRSAAIRAHCETQGAMARDLEAAIVRRAYQQERTK